MYYEEKAIDQLRKVTDEYIRGLVTFAEFFAEAASAVKQIEDIRNDKRI